MNVIKNRFALGGVILLISFAGGLQLIASQYTSDSPNDHFFVWYNSRDRNTRSRYDLFYGMDQDSEGKYCYLALDSV